MKERPIAYSPPMVRAILASLKWQTRRIVTGTALEWLAEDMFSPEFVADPANRMCPYGVPGDRLWVSEEHRVTRGDFHIKQVEYLADGATKECHVTDRELALFLERKHPYAQTRARFMYRSFSRLLLEVTEIRIERLQAISEADALAEGVTPSQSPGHYNITSADGTCAAIMEDYIHGIPESGDTWHGRKITHVQHVPRRVLTCARDQYRALWTTLNGPLSWDANPWVWVIAFKKV